MRNPVDCNPNVAQNLSIGCVLLFLAGASYSLGVFKEAVEQSSHTPGMFEDVLSSSMVWLSLSSMVVMLLAGVFLGEEQQDPGNNTFCINASKTYRVRLLSKIGVSSYLMLPLAAIGVAKGSPLMLRAAIVSQGIAFGIYYLVSLQLLAAWSPSRTGLASGVGQMSFGFGSIFFSAFFESLLTRVTCSIAFLITTAALAVPSAICVALMEWPSREDIQVCRNEISAKAEDNNAILHWRRLPFLLPFWYYVATVFFGQAGFAFIPFFFPMGASFGKSMDAVVLSFQIAIFSSTISRPFLGLLVDSVKWGRGFFAMGSKNVMMILMLLQFTSFTCLISFSKTTNYLGFVVCSSIALVVFCGTAVMAPVLAREMFNPVNSSLVFGVGASIAMGLGEFGTGQLILLLDSSSSGPSRYNPFYLVSAGFSILGLVCCAILQNCPSKYHQNVLIPEVLPKRLNFGSEETQRLIDDPGAMRNGYGNGP